MDRAEVLVASSVRAGASSSRRLKIRCFKSIFSTAASMTRSTASSGVSVAEGEMRSMPSRASMAAMTRRFTAFA